MGVIHLQLQQKPRWLLLIYVSVSFASGTLLSSDYSIGLVQGMQ